MRPLRTRPSVTTRLLPMLVLLIIGGTACSDLVPGIDDDLTPDPVGETSEPAEDASDTASEPADDASDAPSEPADDASDTASEPADDASDAPSEPAEDASDAPSEPADDATEADVVTPITRAQVELVCSDGEALAATAADLGVAESVIAEACALLYPSGS